MDQTSTLLSSPFHLELNDAFRLLRELEKLAKAAIDSGWADDSRDYPKPVEKAAIRVVAALERAMPLSQHSDDYPALKTAPIKRAIRVEGLQCVFDTIEQVLVVYLQYPLRYSVRMKEYLGVLRVLLLLKRVERVLDADTPFTPDEEDFPWICLLYGESPLNIVVDPHKFITTNRFLRRLPPGTDKLIVRAIKNQSWSELRVSLRSVLDFAIRPWQVLPILVLLWTTEEYLIASSQGTCNLFHSTQAGNGGRKFDRSIN